ncbi:unnamed protein product [Effrenium voratum]|nr:unnamed protein product [Effrenium voratum]
MARGVCACYVSVLYTRGLRNTRSIAARVPSKLPCASAMAVALKNSPDFNRPVSLQVGAEAPEASPHKSVVDMEQFYKRYYGEPAQTPHSNKFKPDPKAWYQHTLVVKIPDNDSKKKVRRAIQRNA